MSSLCYLSYPGRYIALLIFFQGIKVYVLIFIFFTVCFFSSNAGRLVLTDHALYFEPLKVVSYDKATRYDLADDLKQIVKPELTGPWGTRLFDKAVAYKSISL